jgi:hypothetical protein
MIYDLPTSLRVCGEEYEINSDFRAILDIIIALNDAALTDSQKVFFALGFFYPDYEKMPIEHHQEALRWCFWFINGGKEDEQLPKRPMKLMDWEQDFQYIVSPVNRVLGFEMRAEKYLHWWTFLAAYMEIGECTFAQIVHIRDAKARGKKLDKADQEWYNRNRKIVDIKTTYTSDEIDLLKQWGGG